MFEFELMTKVNSGLNASCSPNECSPVETTPCGPDYGSDCMPDCDPSDDW